MGTGNFNINQYQQQAEEAKQSENSGFQADTMCDEFNPAKVKTRFSRKGPFNHFRDVITVLVGLDVTGSMDVIPKSLLTGKLGDLMIDLKSEFNRPNENLQISFAGIGDAKSDMAPLQVTHFESDNRFAQQLPKIWLEGHGGGNGAESYNLLWWYAANKTHLNYAQQEGRKGILITIGDDNVHPNLTANEIQMWLDPSYEGGDISNEILLDIVREQYHVYHIVVTDGQAYRYDYLSGAQKTADQKRAEAARWEALLGPGHVFQAVSNDVANAIAEIVVQHRPAEPAIMTNLTLDEWVTEKLNHLTDEQWCDVLSYTLCPLTRSFMERPVVWDGNKRAFEREAVTNYIQKHRKDPLTNEPLLNLPLLKRNLNIAQVCSDYKPYFNALPAQKRRDLVDLVLPPDSSDANSKKMRQRAGAEATRTSQRNDDIDSEQVQQTQTLELDLECPITHEVMRNPVILVATGHTFEKEAIDEWFQNHNTNPVTGEELSDKTLIPNYALKGICDNYHAQNSQAPTVSVT